MDTEITTSRRTFVKGAVAAAGMAAIGGATMALADATTPFVPGTYTATEQGVGMVTVTLTVDEGAITEAVVDVSGETPFHGALLTEAFQSQLSGSPDGVVETISGATLTSWAVQRAAEKCLAQARGEALPEIVDWDDSTDEDWLGTEPTIDEAQISETWDTDILIVGAGNGGMAAAAYAAQNGLNFRVIERNPVVCDTRLFYGAVDTSAAQAAGAEPVDRARLLGEISRYASGKCNQRVVNVWINESAAMHEFVNGILTGEPFNLTCTFNVGEGARWPEAEHVTDYMFPEIEHNFGGWAGEKPRNVVFKEYIESLGYAVDYNTSLVKLEKDGERVSGAIAQSRIDGHFIRINAARGVLLACGGYAANPKMLQALDPMAVSVTTVHGNHPSQLGMGIRVALWAGATLDEESAPMLFDRGLVAPGVDAGYAENPAAFDGKDFPAVLTGTVNRGQYKPGTQPFLKVNRNGERFANESCPYNDISYAAAYQPGGVYAQIHDANYFEDAQRFHTIGCSASVQRGTQFQDELEAQVANGLMMEADTVEELADKLGFEGEAKDNFLATVERYNEIYDMQEDPDFGKMTPRLSEIRTAPFYGGWMGASILTTEQGVTINENMQALDTARVPIEGLYVTGDMSGSFFANNYPCLMAGVACGRTLTFAIKAVKQMAGLE